MKKECPECGLRHNICRCNNTGRSTALTDYTDQEEEDEDEE